MRIERASRVTIKGLYSYLVGGVVNGGAVVGWVVDPGGLDIEPQNGSRDNVDHVSVVGMDMTCAFDPSHGSSGRYLAYGPTCVQVLGLKPPLPRVSNIKLEGVIRSDADPGDYRNANNLSLDLTFASTVPGAGHQYGGAMFGNVANVSGTIKLTGYRFGFNSYGVGDLDDVHLRLVATDIGGKDNGSHSSGQGALWKFGAVKVRNFEVDGALYSNDARRCLTGFSFGPGTSLTNVHFRYDFKASVAPSACRQPDMGYSFNAAPDGLSNVIVDGDMSYWTSAFERGYSAPFSAIYPGMLLGANLRTGIKPSGTVRNGAISLNAGGGASARIATGPLHLPGGMSYAFTWRNNQILARSQVSRELAGGGNAAGQFAVSHAITAGRDVVTVANNAGTAFDGSMTLDCRIAK